MIFVTVGTQLAFDRLVRAVDGWNCKKKYKVYMQIGPSTYKPENAEYSSFIDPSKADNLFQNADLIISHAGMGSILTALRYSKPIIILPRLASLNEHRNDHQLATCKWLGSKSGITVASDVNHLLYLLGERPLDSISSGEAISPYASDELINNLKEYFNR